MSNYEEQNIIRILQELKNIEEKEKIEIRKKIYYIYRRMGEIYSYKEEFSLAPQRTYDEHINKINIAREGVTEDGKALCIDMNKAVVKALRMIGVNANIVYVNDRNPLSHADGCFETEGEYYFFNLTSDIMRIQTGMQVKNFAIPQEMIKEKLEKLYSKNGIVYLYRMIEQNDGKKFSEIPKQQIEKWDDEFGFSYKGIYTDEILEMIKKECADEKLMQEFFETDKQDEIVQKKFDFFMEYVGIIKANHSKSMGNDEALNYYVKLGKSVFTKDEIMNYIEIYSGFSENQGKRTHQSIILIKKENEDIYYIYNQELQKYIQIAEEELLKKPIFNYNNINEIETFSLFIEKNKKRLNEKINNKEETFKDERE